MCEEHDYQDILVVEKRISFDAICCLLDNGLELKQDK